MTNEEAIEILKEQHKSASMFISLKECREYNNAIDMAIEALKTQATDEWIPCCEQLPEESGYYDVTAYDGHENRTTYINFSKRNKTWYLTGRRAHWKVLAWKPKSKPYKVVFK